ncbi:MAG: MYG1 family protein [Candidatus Paceibacterota bacterium]
MPTSIKKIITHNGGFHTDDVFACATLLLLLEKKGEQGEIIRTRDEAIIITGDYVVDVGGIYDPAINRFDHHQIGGAGARGNGISFASFGLVWKEFGEELCGSKEVSEWIDQKIVQPIDGPDNGISIATPIFEGVQPYTFHSILSSFEPSWKDKNEADIDSAFLELVSFAKGILSREIKKTKDTEDGIRLANDIYEQTEDKRLVVLDESYPWKPAYEKNSDVLIVIYPSSTDSRWKVETVPVKPYSFERRIYFPEAWAGLRDEALQKVTGVPDAIFCHFHRFLAVAKSKEGAIALAKQALAN